MTCVFCKKEVKVGEDKTPYSYDRETNEMTWAHWDCYKEAMNNPRDGGDR